MRMVQPQLFVTVIVRLIRGCTRSSAIDTSISGGSKVGIGVWTCAGRRGGTCSATISSQSGSAAHAAYRRSAARRSCQLSDRPLPAATRVRARIDASYARRRSGSPSVSYARFTRAACRFASGDAFASGWILRISVR